MGGYCKSACEKTDTNRSVRLPNLVFVKNAFCVENTIVPNVDHTNVKTQEKARRDAKNKKEQKNKIGEKRGTKTEQKQQQWTRTRAHKKTVTK